MFFLSIVDVPRGSIHAFMSTGALAKNVWI